MPRGDRTGPWGYGSMSGRGAGYCAGYDMPGYANPVFYGGRMDRRMWRRFGWHGRFYGGPCWGWRDDVAYAVPYPADMSPEEKQEMLKTREAWLQEQLEEVHKDMDDIQKETEKEPTK